MKLNWKIYYGDGTTFDDTQGTPNEAPPVNVQVIACYDPDWGRQILHLWDWYYYRKSGENGFWWGCDVHGLLDQLLWDKKGDITAVKQGRTIGNAKFRKMVNDASNDPDFQIVEPGQIYGKGKTDPNAND